MQLNDSIRTMWQCPNDKGESEMKKLERQAIINLAQKGFDYDTKVGPHSRIAQLVMADPGAAQVLNDYIHGKLAPQKQQEPEKFKPLPLADFDTETEWLMANLAEKEKFDARNRQPEPVRQPAKPQIDPHTQMKINQLI